MAFEVIVWEWSTGGEHWNPYMPVVSNYIETSHSSWKSNCQSQAAVHLGVVCAELNRINIDLANNISYDNSTGELCSYVRRRLYGEISFEGCSVIWQWLGDDHINWHCYSLEVHDMLENAYQRGVSILDLDRPPIKLPYTVELRSMQQIRNGSGFKRRIRRHLDPVSYQKESRSDKAPGPSHADMNSHMTLGWPHFGHSTKSPNFTGFQYSAGAPSLPASVTVQSQPQSQSSVFTFQANVVASPCVSVAVPMTNTSTSYKSGASQSTAHKGRERKLKVTQAREEKYQAQGAFPQLTTQPATTTNSSFSNWRQSSSPLFSRESETTHQASTPLPFKTATSSSNSRWRPPSNEDSCTIDDDAEYSNIKMEDQSSELAIATADSASASASASWFSRRFLSGVLHNLMRPARYIYDCVFDTLSVNFTNFSIGKRKRGNVSGQANNSQPSNYFYLGGSSEPAQTTNPGPRSFVRANRMLPNTDWTSSGDTTSMTMTESRILPTNTPGRDTPSTASQKRDVSWLDTHDTSSIYTYGASATNGTSSMQSHHGYVDMASSGSTPRTSSRPNRCSNYWINPSMGTTNGSGLMSSQAGQTVSVLDRMESSAVNATGLLSWPTQIGDVNIDRGGNKTSNISPVNKSFGVASVSSFSRTTGQTAASANSIPQIVVQPSGSSSSTRVYDDSQLVNVKRFRGIDGKCESVLQENGSSDVSAATILYSFGKNVAMPPSTEDCCICCESLADPSGFGGANDVHVVELCNCRHMFHVACLCAMFDSGPKNGCLQCPSCKHIYGTKTGDCPDGLMSYCGLPDHLDGYPDCGSIRITYDIRNGTKNGVRYKARGFPRHGYLPNNDKGNQVLELLKEAWRRRLTFTVGTSVTTNEQNVVVWNEIHHKTSPTNDHGHGYPDPNYLDNVLGELAAQGVTDVRTMESD